MALERFKRIILGTGLTGTDNGDDTITIDAAGGGVSSIAKSGDTALTGAVTLTGGTNITLTQAGQDISIAAAGGAGAGADGWVDDSANTWTYVSAATFTVSGDRTATFGKGTRLKFTQTTVKYGVVYASSHAAGTTTVTIAVNTDYVLANAAISANSFSYSENPQGYPKWFNYATAGAGFSSISATNGYFQLVSGWCFFFVTIDGTSNSTSFSFSLPVTCGPAGGPIIDCYVYDNNATQSTPGNLQLTGNSVTATLRKTVGGATTAWTASAGKGVYITGGFPY